MIADLLIPEVKNINAKRNSDNSTALHLAATGTYQTLNLLEP